MIRLGLLRTLGIDYIPRITARFLKENPDRDIQFTTGYCADRSTQPSARLQALDRVIGDTSVPADLFFTGFRYAECCGSFIFTD